jgi:hypothetical protein
MYIMLNRVLRAARPWVTTRPIALVPTENLV